MISVQPVKIREVVVVVVQIQASEVRWKCLHNCRMQADVTWQLSMSAYVRSSWVIEGCNRPYRSVTNSSLKTWRCCWIIIQWASESRRAEHKCISWVRWRVSKIFKEHLHDCDGNFNWRVLESCYFINLLQKIVLHTNSSNTAAQGCVRWVGGGLCVIPGWVFAFCLPGNCKGGALQNPVEVIRAFSDGSSLLSNSSFWFQCARIPQSFSLGVQMFKLRTEYF